MKRRTVVAVLLSLVAMYMGSVISTAQKAELTNLEKFLKARTEASKMTPAERDEKLLEIVGERNKELAGEMSNLIWIGDRAEATELLVKNMPGLFPKVFMDDCSYCYQIVLDAWQQTMNNCTLTGTAEECLPQANFQACWQFGTAVRCGAPYCGGDEQMFMVMVIAFCFN